MRSQDRIPVVHLLKMSSFSTHKWFSTAKDCVFWVDMHVTSKTMFLVTQVLMVHFSAVTKE